MESQHVDTANDEDGISLADSEKTVESNMTQIIEKLHQATSSRTCCTPAIGNHDHRYIHYHGRTLYIYTYMYACTEGR